MGTVEVYILGQKYLVKGEASPEYVKKLAAFVDEKLKEVYAHSPNVTPLKAAILTALNIADEFHRVNDQYTSISQSIKTIEDKTDSIIRLFE